MCVCVCEQTYINEELTVCDFCAVAGSVAFIIEGNLRKRERGKGGEGGRERVKKKEKRFSPSPSLFLSLSISPIEVKRMRYPVWVLLSMAVHTVV